MKLNFEMGLYFPNFEMTVPVVTMKSINNDFQKYSVIIDQTKGNILSYCETYFSFYSLTIYSEIQSGTLVHQQKSN